MVRSLLVLVAIFRTGAAVTPTHCPARPATFLAVSDGNARRNLRRNLPGDWMALVRVVRAEAEASAAPPVKAVLRVARGIEEFAMKRDSESNELAHQFSLRYGPHVFWTAFRVCVTRLLNDLDEESGSRWMRQQAPSGTSAFQKYQRAAIRLLDWNHLFLIRFPSVSDRSARRRHRVSAISTEPT